MRSYFSINAKLSDISALEHDMVDPYFWSDTKSAQSIIKELKSLKSIVDPYIILKKTVSDHIELLDMAGDTDIEIMQDIVNQIPILTHRLESVETNVYLSGPDDRRSAILAIHSGAGGVDAMDWAANLERMYWRWLIKNGFKPDIVDRQEGEAGIKRVVIEVHGDFAYGRLKSEIGVHRICHVSEFDANHKKQTSFASVDVIPVYEETDIIINERDIEIDTFCSGGPGGQNVNKVATAVRITHLPTNTVVQCQSQRSQNQNKKIAMQLLASRLKAIEDEKHRKSVSAQYDNKADVAFGHQIRTYAHSFVKDHRTHYQTGNVSAVLDGELTPFMESYLRMMAKI